MVECLPSEAKTLGSALSARKEKSRFNKPWGVSKQLSSMASVSVSALTVPPESAKRNQLFHSCPVLVTETLTKTKICTWKGIAIHTDRVFWGGLWLHLNFMLEKPLSTHGSVGCSVWIWKARVFREMQMMEAWLVKLQEEAKTTVVFVWYF